MNSSSPPTTKGSGMMTLRGSARWTSNPDACALTPRSLITGLLIGSLMCCSNMYFGLQTGWVTMGSLQSAILGYGVFQGLKAFTRGRGLSVSENVIIQTTSVATATMPLAAGLVGVIPAFGMMTPKENPPDGALHLSPGQLLLWSLGLAFFGVFIAIPLRVQTIVWEKLKFPSGTATAHIIRTLHKVPLEEKSRGEDGRGDGMGDGSGVQQGRPRVDGEGDDDSEEEDETLPLTNAFRNSTLGPFNSARSLETEHSYISRAGSIIAEDGGVPGFDGVDNWQQAWNTLLITFGGSSAYTILAGMVPLLKSFPVFTWMGYPAATAWGWELTPSMGYIGQGMIMGPRTAWSMMAGALAGYAILGPYARSQGWAPGAIGDWQHGASGWIMWISLAIMLTDSCVSFLLLIVSGLIRQWKRRRASIDPQDWHAMHHNPQEDSPHCALPNWLWLSGLAATTLLCCVIMSHMFHMPLFQPLVAVILALFVAVVAVRALGETDLNPVTGVGKVSQLVFALVAPGQVVPNLVAGAIAEAGAQQAGDMMQDFKTAYLLGVCPRSQFVAMLIGSSASVFISVGAYLLYSYAWEIPGPEFAVPSSQIWLDMAKLVNGGQLPPHVLPYCVGAAAITAGLPLANSLVLRSLPYSAASSRYTLIRWSTWAFRNFMPSGVAFAVGMYLSPKWTIPRVVGSVIQQLWQFSDSASHRSLMLVVASGLVLGEGTASILLAFQRALFKS